MLILFPTDSSKLLMQWKGHTSWRVVWEPKTTVKMGSKTKTYHMNMLKKYIAREPEMDGVPTSIKTFSGLSILQFSKYKITYII